jgi:hypothetical protein
MLTESSEDEMGVKVVDRDPSLGGLTHAHKVLLHLLLQLVRQGVGRLTAHRQVTTQPGFLYPINITKRGVGVADPDPRSGAFLTPGSGIRDRIRDLVHFWPLEPGSGMGKISGSGMNNPDNISESLETSFWVKYINSLNRIRNGKNMDPRWKKIGSGIRNTEERYKNYFKKRFLDPHWSQNLTNITYRVR